MNTYRLITVLLLTGSMAAHAGLYQNFFGSGFANGGNIPDGSTTGWSDSRTISGESGTISSITLNVNVQGGYNGDLYAYLSFNGTLVPLINRVGVGTGNTHGYGDSGFNVTFSSSALNNVHFYQSAGGSLNGSGQLTGVWRPDGRTIDPGSPAPSFDSTANLQSFNSFNGMSSDGSWTLFFSDLAGGGGTSHVVSYELDISTVPEPVNVALGILGSMALLAKLWQLRSRPAVQSAPSPSASTAQS